jgi:hypothetical protein
MPDYKAASTLKKKDTSVEISSKNRTSEMSTAAPKALTDKTDNQSANKVPKGRATSLIKSKNADHGVPQSAQQPHRSNKKDKNDLNLSNKKKQRRQTEAASIEAASR